MNALSSLPLPAASDKSCSFMHGINAAIEALCRPSRLQHQRRTSLIDDEVRTVANRGRIICLSSFKRYSVQTLLIAGYLSLLVQILCPNGA
jgi:hypothetical protein